MAAAIARSAAPDCPRGGIEDLDVWPNFSLWQAPRRVSTETGHEHRVVDALGEAAFVARAERSRGTAKHVPVLHEHDDLVGLAFDATLGFGLHLNQIGLVPAAADAADLPVMDRASRASASRRSGRMEMLAPLTTTLARVRTCCRRW